MALPYKRLAFILFLIAGNFVQAVTTARPLHINCYANSITFLRHHISPNFLRKHGKKPIRYSKVGQLYTWASAHRYLCSALSCRLLGKRHARSVPLSNNPNKKPVDPRSLRPDQFRVRVLLYELGDKESLCLEAEGGVSIAGLDSSGKIYAADDKIVVTKNRGAVRLNGKVITSALVKIHPKKDRTIFLDGTYQGSMLIVYHQGAWMIINEIELEDYLYSVVRWESWPGWPLEVNKAFAIACRSYVLAQIMDCAKKKNKKPYHVHNSNIHQTYKGHHTNQAVRCAVDQTRGFIMTHKQKPIMAMFDCCCGGVIPAHMESVDFRRSPYLARSIPCTFCKESSIYNWQLELDDHQLVALLQESGHKIRSIHDVYIGERDKAGIVKSLTVKEGKKLIEITGRKFYSLLTKVKSFCYDIKKNGKKILIVGKGYGHHLGICQWGARQMIEHGFSHRGILEFYYPGVEFMKLTSKKDSNESKKTSPTFTAGISHERHRNSRPSRCIKRS